MKTINDIKPTTTISEYRSILVAELICTIGVNAKTLSKASISINKAIVYARIGSKTYQGVFNVWEKSLTVTQCN